MTTHKAFEFVEITFGAVFKTAILLTLVWALGSYVTAM